VIALDSRLPGSSKASRKVARTRVSGRPWNASWTGPLPCSAVCVTVWSLVRGTN